MADAVARSGKRRTENRPLGSATQTHWRLFQEQFWWSDGGKFLIGMGLRKRRKRERAKNSLEDFAEREGRGRVAARGEV